MIDKVSNGICNKNCPVFNITKKSRHAPRGFIQLIEEKIYEKNLFDCTMCGNCERDNPVPINIIKELRKAREKLVEEGKEINHFKIMMKNLETVGNIYGIK